MSAQKGSTRRGTARAAQRAQPRDRLRERQADHQRPERDEAGDQRLVEHRHLDDQPAYARRRQRRGLECRVGAERSAEHDRLVDREVVEQRDDLLAEDRRRVARGLGRAIRQAVAEQVDRDDVVAALRKRAGERLVHALRQQEAVDEDDGPRPVAVLRVGDPPPVVSKARYPATITFQPAPSTAVGRLCHVVSRACR
jgi:hypothetical protein